MLCSKELDYMGAILQGNQVFSFYFPQLSLDAQLLDSLNGDFWITLNKKYRTAYKSIKKLHLDLETETKTSLEYNSESKPVV